MSIFNSISNPKVGRNKFDLSYWNYLTCDMGSVVPIMCQHMIPGDKFRINSKIFGRLMPLANPTFQNLTAYTYYFFVPYRLVWEHFEDWITSKPDPNTGQSYVHPYMALGGLDPFVWKHTCLEYLGYKRRSADGSTFTQNQSAFPFRAYWLIYNEWFRDQHVDPEVLVPTTDGEQGIVDDYLNADGTKPDVEGGQSPYFNTYQLFRKRYHKDYFTSALPYPQLQEVSLPMAGYADLVPNGSLLLSTTDDVPSGNVPLNFTSAGGTAGRLSVSEEGYSVSYRGGLQADLSSVTSATINDLRRAVALQHFYELSARGGNRYIEQMLAHFGVRSKDARLQRPEFLGGGSTPIQVGEVLQTSQTTDSSPLGDMAGRGYLVNNSTNGCTYYATEHGMLMAFVSIVPESLYWQGINRHLQKFDPLDYYFPAFAHLGEQEIKNKEIYYSGTSKDEETFGYAPRYAEYKFNNNEIHGEFLDTLKRWHFGREFSETPDLSSEFLSVPNITSPFALDDSSDKYLLQIYHNIDAIRPMPYYSNPQLIG